MANTWDTAGVVEAVWGAWTADDEIQRRKWLASLVASHAGSGRILEVGSGRGDVYVAVVAARDGDLTDYEGVDGSDRMRAESMLRHPGLRVTDGDIHALSYADRSYETVLCFEVLTHLPDMRRPLAELLRVASAQVIFSVPEVEQPPEAFSTVSFLRRGYSADVVHGVIRDSWPNAYIRTYVIGPTNVYVVRRDPVVPRPRHSVILGSYNRPRYVRQAVESVLAQEEVQSWELLIADDGSNAETIDILDGYSWDDSRIVLIPCRDSRDDHATRHFARAVERINDALALSRGDLLHYLPDDDWFAPRRFAAFEKAFLDPHKTLVYGRLQYADRDGVPTNRWIYPGRLVDDPHCILDHTQVVHRAKTRKKVPLWPLTDIRGESDGVFFRELVTHFGAIYPMDELVSFHRAHDFNMQLTGGGPRRE